MPTGSRIKEIRLGKGLTQKQLGDLCGIADSNIRKYENGKQNPKIETLQKIATALKEPLSAFLDAKLSDAALDDEDFETNQVSEIIKKRTKEIIENQGLTNNEKANMLEDLITSGHLIIQDSVDHAYIAQKELLCSYFGKLNFTGRDKALDQVEMLTKISDYRKDIISDIQIMKHESKKEPEPPRRDDPEMEL